MGISVIPKYRRWIRIFPLDRREKKRGANPWICNMVTPGLPTSPSDRHSRTSLSARPPFQEVMLTHASRRPTAQHRLQIHRELRMVPTKPLLCSLGFRA